MCFALVYMSLRSPTTDQVPLQFLMPSSRHLFCPSKQKGHKRWANWRLRLLIFLPLFPFFCHGNPDRPVIGCRCGCVTAHLHKAEPSPSLIYTAFIENGRQPVTAVASGVTWRSTRWILRKHFYLHIFPRERQEGERTERSQLQCGYQSPWSEASIKCQMSVQMEMKRNKSYLWIVCRSLVRILLLLKRRQGPCQHLNPCWR